MSALSSFLVSKNLLNRGGKQYSLLKMNMTELAEKCKTTKSSLSQGASFSYNSMKTLYELIEPYLTDNNDKIAFSKALLDSLRPISQTMPLTHVAGFVTQQDRMTFFKEVINLSPDAISSLEEGIEDKDFSFKVPSHHTKHLLLGYKRAGLTESDRPRSYNTR